MLGLIPTAIIAVARALLLLQLPARNRALDLDRQRDMHAFSFR
jgi:hypothetical protein